MCSESATLPVTLKTSFDLPATKNCTKPLPMAVKIATPYFPHLYIYLNLYSSCICMKYLLLNAKQPTINRLIDQSIRIDFHLHSTLSKSSV